MRFHCLQHGATEGPARIGQWIESHGLSLSTTQLYEGEPLPALKEFDCLIVMGGHMGVYDEKDYPWLRDEKVFLREAAGAGKKILGICLGAQLLAEALGGKVYKGPYFELGWWKLEWSEEALRDPLFANFPPRFNAFQWHGDTFDLPPGAVPLGSSHVYANQGFKLGDNVVAFQFHPEVDEETLLKWVETELSDVPKDRFVQRADEILHQADRLERQQQLLELFLSRFLG